MATRPPPPQRTRISHSALRHNLVVRTPVHSAMCVLPSRRNLLALLMMNGLVLVCQCRVGVPMTIYFKLLVQSACNMVPYPIESSQAAARSTGPGGGH